MKFYFESFFWGIIAALGAFFLQFVGSEFFNVFSFFREGFSNEQIFLSLSFIALASFAEELLKYFIIAKRVAPFFVGRNVFFQSLVVGTGFAVIDIFFIFASFGLEARSNLANIIGIFLLHVSTAGLLGLAFAEAGQKIKKKVLVLTLVWLFHFGFNCLLTSGDSRAEIMALMLIACLIVFNLIGFMRVKNGTCAK